MAMMKHVDATKRPPFDKATAPPPKKARFPVNQRDQVEKTAPLLHFGAMDNFLTDNCGDDDELWLREFALIARIGRQEKISESEIQSLIRWRLSRYATLAEDKIMKRFKKLRKRPGSLSKDHMTCRNKQKKKIL